MYGTGEACPTAATMYSYTAGCGVQLLLPCTERLKLEGMEPTSVAQHCRACAHHCAQATTLDEPLEFILPLLAYMGRVRIIQTLLIKATWARVGVFGTPPIVAAA